MPWERLFHPASGSSSLFAPPAPPGEVDALLADTGLAVPDAFRALYGLADGSARDGEERGGATRYLLADDGLELLATLVERRATGLSSWELSRLSPGARRVDLRPVTPDRFDRPGVPLARVAAPPPRPSTPSLGALAQRASADADALIERVTAAASRALPGIFGDDRRVEVSFDQETGELQLWCLAVIVDEVKRPGLEIGFEAAPGLGEVGDEVCVLVPFRDDPAQEAMAAAQHRHHGAQLAWDDDWARRLDAWRAVYRQLVAEALPSSWSHRADEG